jgi:cyclic pyranopterin phosphate synthase
MALDQFGRNIHYLRISLTDQCNLRCRYCMTESMTFRPPAELMQNHEVIRLARIFAELGFTKFRLTGGEPTIRSGIVELVRELSALPGVRDLAMTTNGVLLKHLAKPLREAGLNRLNISIDSLDPVRFHQITRWGNLNDVWNGIMTAESLGFPIKLNAVPVRGLNDRDDVVSLARLTLAHPWQIRFIEMMPFGDTAEFNNITP